MLAMIQSDLISMKNTLVQLMGICVLVAIFIWIGTGTLIAGVSAICAMVPFMYIFSIAAYDEMNGWERFRLTLPISRRQVVLGRYASILIVIIVADILMVMLSAMVVGALSVIPSLPIDSSLVDGFDPIRECGHVLMISSAMLFAASCTMPLVMRFGMTTGTRLVPIVLVLILMGALFLMGSFEEPLVQAMPMLESIFGIDPEGAMLALEAGIGILAISLIIYAASMLISIRLYEKRQF